MPIPKKPKILFRGKHLQILRRGHWEYAHRPHATGIVGIVAITDAKKIILVEQYRPPLDKRVIELPAGLVGDTEQYKKEQLADAARRELLEETGYSASDMTLLTEGTPSAGICDELITLFLATGLVKTAPGGGDESEDIVVHEVPIKTAHKWLESQRKSGKLLDLKLHSALYFASLRR
jgi:ADP-ribose pyrophosphatase